MFFALFESSRSALVSIYAHGLRSFLTALGIVIGVASVIAVVSVTQGMSAFIGDTFASLGSNSLTIESYTPLADRMKGIRCRLTGEDLDLIEQRLHHANPLCQPHLTSKVWVSDSVQPDNGNHSRFSGCGPILYLYWTLSRSE